MAKKKSSDGPKSLQPLNDEQVATLKKGIEAIETIGERIAQLNADKRAHLDRLGALVEPVGFEKGDVALLIGRRKKDRDRVTGQDLRVHRLEVALGMQTADLFADQAALLKTAPTAAAATDASVMAGNAAAKLDAKAATVKKLETPVAAFKSQEGHANLEIEARKAEGRAAWSRGAGEEACKHPANSPERIHWMMGWDDAQKDWDEEQTLNAGPATPSGAPAKGAAYLRAVGSDL